MAAQLWSKMTNGRPGQEGVREWADDKLWAMRGDEALSPSDLEEAKTLVLISRTLYLKHQVPEKLLPHVLSLDLFATMAAHHTISDTPDRVARIRQAAVREAECSLERFNFVTPSLLVSTVQLLARLGRNKDGLAFGRSHLKYIESSTDPNEPNFDPKLAKQEAYFLMRLSQFMCQEATAPSSGNPAPNGLLDDAVRKQSLTTAGRRLLFEAEPLARKALGLAQRVPQLGPKEVGGLCE